LAKHTPLSGSKAQLGGTGHELSQLIRLTMIVVNQADDRVRFFMELIVYY